MHIAVFLVFLPLFASIEFAFTHRMNENQVYRDNFQTLMPWGFKAGALLTKQYFEKKNVRREKTM